MTARLGEAEKRPPSRVFKKIAAPLAAFFALVVPLTDVLALPLRSGNMPVFAAPLALVLRSPENAESYAARLEASVQKSDDEMGPAAIAFDNEVKPLMDYLAKQNLVERHRNVRDAVAELQDRLIAAGKLQESDIVVPEMGPFGILKERKGKYNLATAQAVHAWLKESREAADAQTAAATSGLSAAVVAVVSVPAQKAAEEAGKIETKKQEAPAPAEEVRPSVEEPPTDFKKAEKKARATGEERPGEIAAGIEAARRETGERAEPWQIPSLNILLPIEKYLEKGLAAIQDNATSRKNAAQTHPKAVKEKLLERAAEVQQAVDAFKERLTQIRKETRYVELSERHVTGTEEQMQGDVRRATEEMEKLRDDIDDYVRKLLGEPIVIGGGGEVQREVTVNVVDMTKERPLVGQHPSNMLACSCGPQVSESIDKLFSYNDTLVQYSIYRETMKNETYIVLPRTAPEDLLANEKEENVAWLNDGNVYVYLTSDGKILDAAQARKDKVTPTVLMTYHEEGHRPGQSYHLHDAEITENNMPYRSYVWALESGPEILKRSQIKSGTLVFNVRPAESVKGEGDDKFVVDFDVQPSPNAR